MTSPFTPVIQGAGAFCAIGRGLAQVDASVRTGLARFRASSVMDRSFEPITLSLVPEEALAPLAPRSEALGFTSRERRMLRLAAPALSEALCSLPQGEPPLPVFLGLPEPRPGRALSAQSLVEALTAQAEVELDASSSQLFPAGRAAALLALAAAAEHLSQHRSRYAVVGGIDSFLDLALLAELDAEQRILGTRVMDGFVPGEGAAFLLLAAPGASSLATPRVAVLGVGLAQDLGHRYSDQPARGEGLSLAIDDLLSRVRPLRPIAHTYAGLNGENFNAKEWGVARLRHSDFFTVDSAIHHPADCYGDCGAATGALLLALSQAALNRNPQSGPALIWASSDRAARACVLIDTLA